jgi:hypothetical protein
MAPRKVYQAIAESLLALRNCEIAVEGYKSEWIAKHRERIKTLCSAALPHGSGFDNGSKLCFEHSKPERLVFETAFHHMNENGYYDGWTEHTVIVTPSLVFGFELRITGRNRNEIKDTIHECFHYALSANEDSPNPRTDLPENAEQASQ